MKKVFFKAILESEDRAKMVVTKKETVLYLPSWALKEYNSRNPSAKVTQKWIEEFAAECWMKCKFKVEHCCVEIKVK